jgi:hypothetical protein
MDPVTTTLVSAFVIGAAKGATKVGDQAITDDPRRAQRFSSLATCGSVFDRLRMIKV